MHSLEGRDDPHSGLPLPLAIPPGVQELPRARMAARSPRPAVLWSYPCRYTEPRGTIHSDELGTGQRPARPGTWSGPDERDLVGRVGTGARGCAGAGGPGWAAAEL